ncbi:MAG: mevalonate kinase [Maribacter sp.]|jgi:mevalonate kinase
MTESFYSNGKLLLSGEYAILDGAEGWAIPTTFGQSLKLTKNTSRILSWESLNADGCIWFEGSYDLEDFTKISASDEDISKTLINLLKQTRILQPKFLVDTDGCAIETELTFPRNWGLGTSSTLINNMAQLAKVNPYSLLKESFGGSGYDIACAQNDHPIVFKIKKNQPIIREVKPILPFSNGLYFVYLNQKKNSREAISAYREQPIDKEALVKTITEITRELLQATTLNGFESVLNLHEKTLSYALNVPTIKEELFPDYTGSVKSLGGWGGDFVLVTERENTINYFKTKGYTTILSYADMVLQK